MKQLFDQFAAVDKSILPWLGRTSKAIDLFIADSFSKKGISLTKAQLILLRRLVMHQGIPQNNLAYITNRDKTSLTRLIQTMEKKGMVKREPDKDDKRVNLVYITKYGQETLEKAFPVIYNIIDNIQTGISSHELANAIDVLKKISININADDLTAPLTIK